MSSPHKNRMTDAEYRAHQKKNKIRKEEVHQKAMIHYKLDETKNPAHNPKKHHTIYSPGKDIESKPTHMSHHATYHKAKKAFGKYKANHPHHEVLHFGPDDKGKTIIHHKHYPRHDDQYGGGSPPQGD
jgi:hypothetical protein